MSRLVIGATALAAIATLGGCAAGGNGPSATSLPMGSSCGSIRSELRRMDNRGVPSKVEALNAGRRLSSRDRALAKRYNTLLNQYLGARCHT
ncbi:MAG: hypothetical protein K0U74_17130 [Alphaproteobacteria bacterium]|nr:hypothetical protein [Alphaproteobacteria bacterium]